MAIRNPVLFGLNISNNFTDVLSRNQCLENLGLNSNDLEVIRGISSTSLTKIDLQNVSGLDVNLTRYLSRLKSDTSLYAGIVEKVGGYQSVLQGNFEANGAISGGAIRFKYISNNSGSGLTEDDIKFGDISTSRVSSWSSASTDPNNTEQAISYGGSVQVKGTVKIGRKNTPAYQPDSLESIINVLDVPEPIRFPTEVPTDVLEIKINDQIRYVYAMRGIPIVFLTAFKRVRVEMGIIPIAGGGNPTYTILDTDPDATEIKSTPSLISGTTSILVFNSSSFKERELKIYFPPNNIEILNIPSLSIVELPPIKFLNLKKINLSKNNIQTIPDFNKLNYILDGSNNPPIATLNTINLKQNPLFLSDIDEYSRWGTYSVKRLPKTLTSLNINDTHTGEQDWQNVENFVAIRASQSEFNAIVCDPVTTQTNSFTFDLQGGGTQVTEIEGIFFDKLVFSKDQTTYYYVYVENPTTTANEPSGADWEQFIKTRYNGSSKKLDVLDLSTRCPNLEIYNHNEISGRRIFKTPLSKYPNLDDNELFDYVSDAQEYTPRVELRTIETYNLVDNRFTKLNPIFKTPSNYLGINEESSLKIFNVNSNGRALTEPDGSIDFSVMTDIRTINISTTNLSIPTGLSGKQELRIFSAYRVNFPGRPTIGVPPVYGVLHPGGGNIDGLTGEGNPSNANNILFNSKYPTSGGGYVFSNCEKLATLSFPYSNIDGMIPKFTGNNVLRNLDLRSTNIEGGRPPMPSNNGISGRRFVAWDDTFADCVNTLVNLRISGQNLGKNIGIYDPINKTYTSAAFQGSTFNLPFLQRLDIISSREYLRGDFFSLSGLSSLRFLNSYSSGWGKDIPGGTPLPSFQGKNLLEEVRLYNNNFSGEINLKNLPLLKKMILRQNNLSTFGDYEGLNNLIILSVSNNPNLTGSLPNFSTGSPNIQTISLNGCNLNSYIQESIADLVKLRSIDLANNSFNSSSIDTILNDCLVNYSNAPRKGVVVNLSGNSSPSRNVITIPTISTSSNSYAIDVQQPSPTTAQLFTFFPRGSNGLITEVPNQLDLKDGIDPNNNNISYATKIFQNGDDITSSVTIDFINNSITFPESGGSPPSGTEINFVVESTVTGSRVEVTGGVVTVNSLRSLGWIISIRNPTGE